MSSGGITSTKPATSWPECVAIYITIKCRAKKETKDPRAITMKNGKPSSGRILRLEKSTREQVLAVLRGLTGRGDKHP